MVVTTTPIELGHVVRLGEVKTRLWKLTVAPQLFGSAVCLLFVPPSTPWSASLFSGHGPLGFDLSIVSCLFPFSRDSEVLCPLPPLSRIQTLGALARLSTPGAHAMRDQVSGLST